MLSDKIKKLIFNALKILPSIIFVILFLAAPFIICKCNSNPLLKKERCSASLHPDPIVGEMFILQIGQIKSDNEICKIEEVEEYIENCTWRWEIERDALGYDPNFDCVYCQGRWKTLVRRIICPSGKNGQSMVTDDGTKFHREVLK